LPALAAEVVNRNTIAVESRVGRIDVRSAARSTLCLLLTISGLISLAGSYIHRPNPLAN